LSEKIVEYKHVQMDTSIAKHCKGDFQMDSRNQQVLFKDLLVKVYEKGETEQNISTIDIVRDLANELREIIGDK
jgi:hypothetical protein